MTSPGEGAPDGAYVVGSPGDYGRPESEIVGQWTNRVGGGFKNSQTAFDIPGILAALGQVAAEFINGLIDGVIAAGGFVVGVVNDIIGGIVNLFANIARAVQGLGAAGMPDAFEPGPLADIADGQRALIDQAYLLEDNAGFCNLTMSKNWKVTGNVNKWVPIQFDTYVTANKNAAKGTIINASPGITWPCLTLLAPGVWEVDARVVLETGVTTHRYFETEVRAYRVQKGVYEGEWIAIDEYSVSRVPGMSSDNRIASGAIHKPLLIPEFPVDHPATGIFRYAVVVFARFDVQSSWTVWGGTRWASLSANRLSVDTTDYSPPDEGVGTGTIAEGAV